MLKFGNRFRQLLTRGDIQISWGDGKSIQLRELSENLDKDLQPIQDDVEALRQELAKLHDDLAAAGHESTAASASAPVSFAPEDEESTHERQIQAALGDPRFRWRSLQRLAAVSGSDQQDVLEILQSGLFVVSTDKSGRVIARLKSR